MISSERAWDPVATTEPTATLVPEHILTAPLRWRRPRRIFVNSMGDLFHDSVPDEWVDQVFAVMALAPQHTFQVLTKRSARIRAYLGDEGAVRRIYKVVNALRYSESPDADRQPRAFHRWINQSSRDTAWLTEGGCASEHFKFKEPGRAYPSWVRWPLPNVWLGVSAEDQRRADERVPDLLATPAAVRFVSAEPLLGPIDFRGIDLPGGWNEVLPLGARWLDRLEPGEQEDARLDWIIVGGESGPNARPMHPAWARSIRDQCAAAGVAFHFKQWSALRPHDLGRLLDGIEHNGMPPTPTTPTAPERERQDG